MPEIVNIRKSFSGGLNNDSIVDHAVMAAVSEIDKNLMFTLADAGDIEAVLTFNGVEVPFTDFLNRFEKEADKWIEKRAAEMVEEKCQSLYDKIDDLTSGVNKLLFQHFPGRELKDF